MAKEISLLLYHHARDITFCTFGEVTQVPSINLDKEPSYDQFFDRLLDGHYRWIEEKVGFYPLFLSVGSTILDILTTGYLHQVDSKGSSQNKALFSFAKLKRSGVFMDYWNAFDIYNHDLTQEQIELIYRPSWRKKDWLKYVRQNPGSVQLVVPKLDLREAELVSVRDQTSRDLMEQMGFRNIEVNLLVS